MKNWGSALFSDAHAGKILSPYIGEHCAILFTRVGTSYGKIVSPGYFMAYPTIRRGMYPKISQRLLDFLQNTPLWDVSEVSIGVHVECDGSSMGAISMVLIGKRFQRTPLFRSTCRATPRIIGLDALESERQRQQ